MVQVGAWRKYVPATKHSTNLNASKREQTRANASWNAQDTLARFNTGSMCIISMLGCLGRTAHY